ncbi:UDP-glycosyltransferase UGT5-like [Cloeon dipterum]|uniref:UDP-glycosyltransferase UGT5-like n=1 Tax=Cloeon dipterum TaxID=197152 RepID=UPI00321F6ECD
MGRSLALALILLCLAISDGARILGYFPVPGTSHMLVFSALTRALAERGHELVVVSTYPLKDPPSNYTDISIAESMEEYLKAFTDVNLYDYADEYIITVPFAYWLEAKNITELSLRNSDVQKLLKDERGFDLVIVEDFMCDSTFALGHHFKAPIVLISSMGGFQWSNEAVGNPITTSYVANSVLPFTSKMNFWERLVNTAFKIYWDIGSEIFYFPSQESLKKEIFGPNVPHVKDLRRTASLVLTNNHYAFNQPRPLVPNFVEVGGMHVKPPSKPLPKDIKEWLDGGKDGVIYFSMGSNLQGKLFPEEKRKALVQAFAELPQRILWKWESESIPEQPKNVKVASWMPQQEILAHPNVKVFITHGGLLSAQEAMYHGVPLIGIPVFGDQKLNVNRAAMSGYALRLDLKNITKESVLWAVTTALNDKSMLAEAQKRSKIFHDQPEKPLDRAVYWVEYVLRHNGAHHLRSAALDLNCFQLALLDVYAFLLIIVAVFVSIPIITVKKLCCKKSSKSNLAVTGRKKKQ